MTEFGKRLRTCRKKGGLTQEQLGRLLGEALGDRGFSGAAVSDWERGVSRIHADNRLVLVNLVRVLHQVCGVASPREANNLLEAGNYRALDAREQELVFPKLNPLPNPCAGADSPPAAPGWAGLFSIPNDEMQSLLQQAQEGPPPAWPRILVALLNRSTGRITPSNLLSSLFWIWTWLLAWALLAPSLRWPFVTRQDAIWAVTWYAVGSLILPAWVAAQTRTRENPFWAERGLGNGWNLRLYTHQGAGIGFHVGYFLAFVIALLGYNLGIPSMKWAEWLAVLPPLGLAYAGARLVPYNILRAFQDLKLSHGAIFFVFILLGPLWAAFFYAYSSLLTQRTVGLAFFLLAVTLLAAWSVYQARRGRT
ncbi:MAG: helix-turn-helix domain-containing protein [Chloroflexota bacterium]